MFLYIFISYTVLSKCHTIGSQFILSKPTTTGLHHSMRTITHLLENVLCIVAEVAGSHMCSIILSVCSCTGTFLHSEHHFSCLERCPRENLLEHLHNTRVTVQNPIWFGKSYKTVHYERKWIKNDCQNHSPCLPMVKTCSSTPYSHHW